MSIKIKLFAAIKATAEVLVGVSAGAAASAGVFALITVIGILPRWAGHTRTARHVSLYEWSVILGGTAGNLIFLLQPSLPGKEILEAAGWAEGDDGIREKDGARAEFTMLYPASDSVRQALAEDSKNQLAELGIEVTTEGVDWDTAYTRAESEPLVWGWGAHTPMELYNIYHTMSETGLAEYSPYANETVDKYMDEALASSNLEESYDLWKKAQWDGTTGITQEGDIPWIWLCNIDHLYFVRDGLKVADQKLHPHGHGWSIVNNVDQWEWE